MSASEKRNCSHIWPTVNKRIKILNKKSLFQFDEHNSNKCSQFFPRTEKQQTHNELTIILFFMDGNNLMFLEYFGHLSK